MYDERCYVLVISVILVSNSWNSLISEKTRESCSLEAANKRQATKIPQTTR